MSTPPPDDAAAEARLDSLIAVHEELAKQAHTRRQRADTLAATLMTTAVALGAGLVAAANALRDSTPLTGGQVTVAIGALVGTLAFGGASLASILQKVRGRKAPAAPLWKRETTLTSALSEMAIEAEAGAPGPDTLSIKRTILELWRTKSDIGRRTMRFKNTLLLGAALCLAVALTTLVVIGLSVLADA